MPSTSGFGFSLIGATECLSRLKKIRTAQVKRNQKALLRGAKWIFDESQELVPVEDGDLRDSGKIGEVRNTVGSNQFQSTPTITIEYGTTPETAEYAQVVHDHESDISPPSWKGKQIQWTKPGTGPHFLSIPIAKATGIIAVPMSKALDLENGDDE